MPAKRRQRRSTKSFSQRVKNVIKKQAEVKYSIPATLHSTSLTVSGGLQHNCVGAISQGDSKNERIGDKIKVKDLQVRLTLKHTDYGHMVRVYLYQVRGKLGDFDNALNDIYPQDFFPNLEKTDGHTYKVLFNRVYPLEVGKAYKFLKLNIPAKKLLIDEIQFDEASSNILDGEIMLGIETTSTTANEVSSWVSTKLRFYD